MEKKGTVIGIYITPEKSTPTRKVEQVEAVEGIGLKGDRYFKKQLKKNPDQRSPEKELTLIEYESVEMLNQNYDFGEVRAGDLRRNVITQNIRLNPLVGRTFRVGEVVAHGLELCEPCIHLEKLTDKKIMKPLVHKGGIRAKIVKGGIIRNGDNIFVEG